MLESKIWVGACLGLSLVVSVGCGDSDGGSKSSGGAGGSDGGSGGTGGTGGTGGGDGGTGGLSACVGELSSKVSGCVSLSDPEINTGHIDGPIADFGAAVPCDRDREFGPGSGDELTFRVSDGTTEISISLDPPAGFEPSRLALGTPVGVDFELDIANDDQAPRWGAVSIADAEGPLIAWAWNTPDITLGDCTISAADQECEEDCHIRLALDVTCGGAQATVANGATEVVGDFAVTNERMALFTESDECGAGEGDAYYDGVVTVVRID